MRGAEGAAARSQLGAAPLGAHGAAPPGWALRWEAGPSRAVGTSACRDRGRIPPGPRSLPADPRRGWPGPGGRQVVLPSRAVPSRAGRAAAGLGGREAEAAAGGCGFALLSPPPSLLPRVGSERSWGEKLGQAGSWGAAPAGAASSQRQLTGK